MSRQIPIDASTIQKSDGQLSFVRLNRSEIWQHLLFAASFAVLVVTGFMLRMPEKYLSYLGDSREMVFMVRSVLHRAAGVVMIAVSVYHLYYLMAKPAGRRWFFDMRPTLKDIKDVFHNLKYYTGMEKAPPRFDRFCYKHKIEYGALIAGTTIMSITGLLLWTESNWSKFWLDISILVHGMEAILACLAIMIWHLYEVLLKPHHAPMDNLWWTGNIDEATMKAEYPLHYEKIMADPELQKIYIVGGSRMAHDKEQNPSAEAVMFIEQG